MTWWLGGLISFNRANSNIIFYLNFFTNWTRKYTKHFKASRLSFMRIQVGLTFTKAWKCSRVYKESYKFIFSCLTIPKNAQSKMGVFRAHFIVRPGPAFILTITANMNKKPFFEESHCIIHCKVCNHFVGMARVNSKHQKNLLWAKKLRPQYKVLGLSICSSHKPLSHY